MSKPTLPVKKLWNPFQARTEVPDLMRGVAEHEMLEVPSETKTFTGFPKNAKGNIRFSQSLSPRDRINPSECYVEFEGFLRDGGDAAPVTLADTALAQFGFANAIKKVDTQLGNRTVETMNDANLAASALYHLTKSEQWFATNGSAAFAEESFATRLNKIPIDGTTDGSFQCAYYPPTGFWSHTGLVRVGRGLQLILDPDTNWDSLVIQSTTNHKTSQVDDQGAPDPDEYLIYLTGVRLYLSVYRTNDEEKLPPLDVLSLQSSAVYHIQETTDLNLKANINAGSVDTNAVAVFFHELNQANNVDTRISIANHGMKAFEFTQVELQYAGRTYPATKYELDYNNKKVNRAYQDFMMASSGDANPAGGSMDTEVWRLNHALFAWKTPRRIGASSEIIKLNVVRDLVAKMSPHIIVFYVSTMVIKYDSAEGYIASVARFDSERELKEQYSLAVAPITPKIKPLVGLQ